MCSYISQIWNCLTDNIVVDHILDCVCPMEHYKRAEVRNKASEIFSKILADIDADTTPNKKVAVGIIDFQNDFAEGGSLAVAGTKRAAAMTNHVVKELLAKGVLSYVFESVDWHPNNHSSFAANHEGKKDFSTVEMYYNNGQRVPTKENSTETIIQTLWPKHCVIGTKGAELLKEIDPSIIKASYYKGQNRDADSYSLVKDAAGNPASRAVEDLQEIGITHIFLAGVAGNICVRFSAEDLKNALPNVKVTVVQDLTASVPDQFAGPTTAAAALESFKKVGVRVL